MATTWPPKDPDDVLDYGFNYDDWMPAGDTIIASTWAVVGAGLSTSGESFTDMTTTVILSNGTLHTTYQLTNHIVTAGGRERDLTATIRIVEQ